MQANKWSLPLGDTYFASILAQDPRGFEIDHLDLALAHCKRFRTAVDGGAHVGTWSVAMAKRFEHVLAIEPAVDTFACLTANIAGIPSITAHLKALGASQGSGRIADDPTRVGNTGSRHLADVGQAKAVEIVPLDEFQLMNLDFLKLDVEGYEAHALAGAANTIARWHPVVMIECKKFQPPRFGSSPEAAVHLLAEMGYREVARARNDRVYVHG